MGKKCVFFSFFIFLLYLFCGTNAHRKFCYIFMPAGFGMPSKKMDEQTRLGSGLHSFFNSFFVQAMPGQLHTFSIHKLLGLALPTIVKRNGKKSLSNSFEYSYFYDCEKIVLI